VFEKLDILRMAQGLAAYSADRQAMVAQNVANSDTPGYRARDLRSFDQIYDTEAGLQMRETRPGHLSKTPSIIDPATIVDAGGEESPNGNNVSLEGEMIRSVEVKRGHDMALAVYRTSMELMRTSLGRGR